MACDSHVMTCDSHVMTCDSHVMTCDSHDMACDSHVTCLLPSVPLMFDADIADHWVISWEGLTLG